MKKAWQFGIGAVLLLAMFGCSMPTMFGMRPADQGALPTDTVSDTLRSASGPFAFETLLPVTLDLRVAPYYQDLSSGPALLPLPIQETEIFVTLKDSQGRQVWAGKVGADGKITAQLQLPAAPEDIRLTLSAPGFAERSVLIRDMRQFSTVSRRMGLLAMGIQAKGDGLTDSDGDAVPDIYDVAPNDPGYAFSSTVPADGWLTIAFEDLFLQAQAGDADYNDFIGRYKIEVLSDGLNRVTGYKAEAWADVKLAGYNHLFGMFFDFFAGDAVLSVDYYDKTGLRVGGVQNMAVRGSANVVLFPSTRDSVGRRTALSLSFNSPQEQGHVVLPPFNPYLLVYNTGYDIHMIDKESLPVSRNAGSTFRDAQGFPWALMVPTPDKWNHPNETQRIEVPYPRFTLWRESFGDQHVDWYLHYYDPYVPPTEPTVKLAVDLNPGAGGSFPANPVVFNNALYLSADDGSTGTELWRFNGSSASRAADLNTSVSSNPRFLTVYNGNLYLQALRSSSLTELIRFDGSTATAVSGLSVPSHLAVFNSRLYLSARDTVERGLELFSYDGVSPSLAAELNTALNAGSQPTYLTVYNNALYFAADDGVNGKELWKYDGASASLVRNLAPGAGSSNPSYLVVYNGVLYFRATDGSGGYELYKYDDSTVSLAAAVNSAGDGLAPSSMIVYNNSLYFVGTDGSSGWELWRYNGSTASQVADINSGVEDGLDINTYFAVFDSKLFFGASDGSPSGAGRELWKYDGTVASLSADINPGNGDSNPKFLAVFNSRLYFQASTGASGAELWMLYY